MTIEIAVDAGNALVKLKGIHQSKKRQEPEIVFPHARFRLSESEYQHRLQSPLGAGGILLVNGVPYLFGEDAAGYDYERRQGSRKYAEGYYASLVVAGMTMLGYESDDVWLWGAYPPDDHQFREDLMRGVIGRWHVQGEGLDVEYNIEWASAIDEALGGWAHVHLTAEGADYKRDGIGEGNCLIIDVGGGTTDYMSINVKGEVDYHIAFSRGYGINRAVEGLYSRLRQQYPEVFRDDRTFPVDRLTNALGTNIYKAGGAGEFDVTHEADELLGKLVISIRDEFRGPLIGGRTQWDNVLLTGGGAGAVYNRLVPLLEHNSVILADDPGEIHLANVRGLVKLYRRLESKGVFDG